MSTEDNKALVRRFYEEFCNQGDLKVADELVLTNYVEHENVLQRYTQRLILMTK